MSLNIIYDIGIASYALSLLFYISDCLSRNRAAKRIGTGLLVVGSLAQVAALANRLLWAESMPLFTSFDFLLLSSLGISLIAIALNYVKRAEFSVLFINTAGLCILLYNRTLLTSGQSPLDGWQTVQELLMIHIGLASISFTALTVGAVFAGLYAFLHSRLKHKKWNTVIRRLPSLESLDHYSYSALLVGTPILMVSLVLAVLSLMKEGEWMLLSDLKVISSTAALGVYIFYFVKRRVLGGSALQTARWALIGFALLILNFFVNAWSEFHRWSGV